MSTFSIRYNRQLRSKEIRVSLPFRLRGRIWNLLKRHDYEVGKTTDSNWHYTESVFLDVAENLLFAYGKSKLTTKNYTPGDEDSIYVTLENFVKNTSHPEVFDVLEIFFKNCLPDGAEKFQKELNEILDEEECPWRMANGYLFRVDNQFIGAQILSKAQHLLKTNDFHGPLQEFEEARKDLTAGDAKGAIANACLSFESVLKTVCGEAHGNASVLIRKLNALGFWSDLPEYVRKALEEQVLMTLPTIGNRLGRHGQGKDAVEVPFHYAELAVGLAACFNIFLINKFMKEKPQTKTSLPINNSLEELFTEEVPF